MPSTHSLALAMNPTPNPPDSSQQRGQRLLFVAGLFAVLLNYPLLAAFDHDGRVAGVPVLYLYVLLTWLLLITLTGWLVRKAG
ncbi:hypothetical protein [Hymenobacter sp. BRD128]|uniref:hypothetical protein n=1 Tax=Hymenobacter sp. BRD128 TaxID=2675878 RepID=UPI001C25625C|nr:hypothetical protein [Hymenobacter sp. BRD128]